MSTALKNRIQTIRDHPPEPKSQLTLLRLTSIPGTSRPPPFTPSPQRRVSQQGSLHTALPPLEPRPRTLPTQSHVPHMLPPFLALPTSRLPFLLRAATARQDPHLPCLSLRSGPAAHGSSAPVTPRARTARSAPHTPGPASCPPARPRPGPFSAAPEARRVLQALLEVHGHLHGGGARRCLRCCGYWRWWRGEPGARRDRARAGGRGGEAAARGDGAVRGEGAVTGAPCARPVRARLTARAASSDRPRERAARRQSQRERGELRRQSPNKRGRSEGAANRRHRSDCPRPGVLRVTAGPANGQAAAGLPPIGSSIAAAARVTDSTERPARPSPP